MAWKCITIICEIDSQWEFAVCLKELKPGLCDNLEGWDGKIGGKHKREGMYVYIWMILEKEMATHSSILAWAIPWAQKPGWATVLGVSKSQTRLSD